ncbi:MAG: DUF4404 family protein [Chitinispirillaceae bacterium]|nr:DUF4404 family protein [Chitinispirillaceae bacterium]
MIDETIKRIEKTVTDTGILTGERKAELLHLVADLKKEVGELGKTHHEHAGSIASYAESSVREAVRSEPDTELLEHTLNGLSLSVRRFEVSHPTLIGIINNIGQVLSNIGI